MKFDRADSPEGTRVGMMEDGVLVLVVDGSQFFPYRFDFRREALSVLRSFTGEHVRNTVYLGGSGKLIRGTLWTC
jgi:hypothetical protein